ncbi:DUF4177 domain-containing protein [Thalassococcus sp. S3]|uniref:DUF4177 domain-containing protein n=1 Tax=Thalassococcus sp. S3 TaxID=2017482 RepID=UPI00102C1F13|nr:DUF4177 domain-containing protein [Thalassococcus sp. S3]
MRRYEYKVVAAPTKGEKAKGLRGAEARFAFAVEQVINRMAEDGWEYLRSDMLPSDERQGLTGSTTNWRNLLVFCRPAQTRTDSFAPRLLEAPEPDDPPAAEAPRTDNGVEEPDEVPEISTALRVRAAQRQGAADMPKTAPHDEVPDTPNDIDKGSDEGTRR